MFQTRGFKALVTICGVLIVVAVCFEAYTRLEKRGKRIIESHPVDARIQISNPPAILDVRIVQSLLDEAYAYVGENRGNYDRVRDVLDASVLTDIANLYTGTRTRNGEEISSQAMGYNAWISRITEVHRDVAKDKSVQTIQIVAEWRTPAAWIRVDDPAAAATMPAATTASAPAGGPATMPAVAVPAKPAATPVFYLIDAAGVRLPGEYHVVDRTGAGLMTLTGVEMPIIDGKSAVPAPGQRWTAGKGSVLGEDLLAGLDMVGALSRQKFARQIDAVDMANFKGRRDPLAAWIVLDTVWRREDGLPSVVEWGRPIGEEKYFEVQAPVKIQRLEALEQTYKRIDAGRERVDIRFDATWGPRIASQGPAAPDPAAHG